VLLIGDQAFGMKRVNPLDWRTNVSRGAKAEPMELTADLVAQARTAANAVGAIVAGIDFLPDNAGNLYVLEVNAVPGWQAISRVTGHDIAATVLGLARRASTGVPH
jgi:ribosomal protein S6--L-glutamate ligase